MSHNLTLTLESLPVTLCALRRAELDTQADASILAGRMLTFLPTDLAWFRSRSLPSTTEGK